MSIGGLLRVRAAMKPISTVPRALDTVDVATDEPARAHPPALRRLRGARGGRRRRGDGRARARRGLPGEVRRRLGERDAPQPRGLPGRHPGPMRTWDGLMAARRARRAARGRARPPWGGAGRRCSGCRCTTPTRPSRPRRAHDLRHLRRRRRAGLPGARAGRGGPRARRGRRRPGAGRRRTRRPGHRAAARRPDRGVPRRRHRGRRRSGSGSTRAGRCSPCNPRASWVRLMKRAPPALRAGRAPSGSTPPGARPQDVAAEVAGLLGES